MRSTAAYQLPQLEADSRRQPPSWTRILRAQTQEHTGHHQQRLSASLSRNNICIDRETRDNIRFFFLWGFAVIEYYSAHLIHKYIINNQFDNEVWDYLIGESRPSISQPHRQELLKQSGIFDGIEDRINRIRYFRNKFAHNPFTPIRWEEGNVESNMEELVDIIDTLYAALDDEETQEEILTGNGLE